LTGHHPQTGAKYPPEGQVAASEVDVQGLGCPFARGTLGRCGAGGAHRVGRIRGLAGMVHHGGGGRIPPGGLKVGSRMDGAHRKVDRLKEGQPEIIGLFQRRRGGTSHRVMDGGMLPRLVRTRAGDVAKVREDTGVEVDGAPQVQGDPGSGGQALRPEEKVQERRKTGLRQASANIYADVSGVNANVDNHSKLVMGKFVAHCDLRVGARGPAAWPTIDFIKMSRKSQYCLVALRRGRLTNTPLRPAF